MIDLLIGGLVIVILCSVYKSYGFLAMCAGYAVWRFLNHNVPKLFGLEPMRAEDSMWFTDEPGNAMVEMGSAIIDRDTIEYFKEQARISTQAKRFRQVPTFFLGKPCWKEDKNYDVMKHHNGHSDPVASKEQLKEILDGFYNQPLNPDISPWCYLIVENYLEKYSVAVFKFHHILADGMAVMSCWTNTQDEKPQYLKIPKPSFVASSVATICSVIMLPYYLLPLLLRKDYQFCLHGRKCSDYRTSDFTDPIPLQPVKDYCKEQGLKLNTFMYSAMGEAIRRYAEKYDKVPPLVNLCIPYSMRPYPEDGSKIEMNNDLAILTWTQPLIEDRVTRQKELDRMLEGIKNSVEPLSQSLLVKLVVGHLPYTLARHIIMDNCRKVTIVFTNVPGPINVINVHGKKLKQMAFALNAPGKIGLMFGVFTYNNELTVSGTIDKAFAESPTELLGYFQDEILNACKSS